MSEFLPQAGMIPNVATFDGTFKTKEFTPMAHITVVGSTALDTIETPFGRVEEIPGGSALFISAAASLFATVHLVGVVGNDFPLEKIAFFRERGVDFDGLEVVRGPTFRWEGFYHRDMNRRDTISVDLGVFENFDPHLPPSAAEAGYLMLANIDPALQQRVLDQSHSPRLVALDSMNHWITGSRSLLESLLERVDLFLLNDEELTLLTDESSLLAGAEKLLSKGLKYVVVKKGEHGSTTVSRDGFTFLCPAYPLSGPKDPTGAGDTFAGALIGYLAATDDLGPFNIRRAIVYGTVAASFAVEDFGLARLMTLTNDELQKRFRRFQAMVEF